MGFISWLIEEVVDAFSDDSAGKVADVLADGTGAAGASEGLDFVDPLDGEGALTAAPGQDFVDPLAAGKQIIASDPVLSGVQDTMSSASDVYREAIGTDHVPSGPESTQQFISGVMNASPEQLDRMSTQLEGMNVESDIRQSVAESEAQLRESNATHQMIQDTNAADLEAQAQISEAESLLNKTNRDLGTAY